MDKHNQRLMSIDALRGFDMLFIMGFSSLIVAICSLFPDGAECWLAKNMVHVKWNGLSHHDTIFPLFLFLAGISFPFSYAKQQSSQCPKGKIYLKIFKRAAILVCLGLLYNGILNLNPERIRVCSVLGRIGIAWMCAALLYINFKASTRAIIAAAILIGYWLLLRFIPAPDMPQADPYSLEGNLVGYIDRMITPGRLHTRNIFDPEGLFSTIPAIVTAMLGVFTGEFIRIPDEKISGGRKTLYMVMAAIALLTAGLVWNLVFPINKSLWTSSFVLTVGAYSVGIFAIFYYIIDVRKWRKWTFFFRVIGMNSITIYMAQKIINFSNANNFFFKGIAEKLPDQWEAVVMKLGYVMICWLFLYILYKKKIFLKV